MKTLDWRSEGFRRWAVLAGMLIAIALVVHSIFGENGFLTLRQKRREYKSLSHQIVQLKQENGSLEKEVQGLKSDPATIERYAREELHMARQGEVIYMLPQQPAKGGDAALTPGPSPKP